jgi:hypothetical protein
MEELTRFLASWEFSSPRSFWIGSAAALFLIFFPFPGRKRGLALDLQFWKRRVAFRSERVWVLSILVALASLLMGAVLADPHLVRKKTVRIYGKPVMVVIDVSGSMEYRPRRRPTAPMLPREEELSNFEKARKAFQNLLSRNPEVDFGLLLFSTENYVARYFTPKHELLSDTLENKEEITFISLGTRAAEALAKARTFFTENVEAREKAIVLISDLEGDLEATMKMAEELERDLWTGIKVYVVVIEKDRKTGVDGSQRLSSIEELKMVGMYDEAGIDRICAEMATLERSPIREETAVEKRSLIPFLIPPLLGLMVLCLVLSETRFRKVP